MARDLADTGPESVGLTSAGLDAVDAGLQEQIDLGQLAGAVTLVARHGRVARRRTRLGGRAAIAAGS